MLVGKSIENQIFTKIAIETFTDTAAAVLTENNVDGMDVTTGKENKTTFPPKL